MKASTSKTSVLKTTKAVAFIAGLIIRLHLRLKIKGIKKGSDTKSCKPDSSTNAAHASVY